MQFTEETIRNVVAQVLAEVGQAPPVAASHTGRHGVFTCAQEAVAAARTAFEQLRERTIEDRKRMIGPHPADFHRAKSGARYDGNGRNPDWSPGAQDCQTPDAR